MKKIACSFSWLLFVMSMLLPGRLAASVEHDARIPQLAFAAQERRARRPGNRRIHSGMAESGHDGCVEYSKSLTGTA